MSDDQPKHSQAYRVIGTRPIRHDGTDKVAGRALYGADVRLPGMLYGAVLRSPHAHARIIAINTKKAEALPGVKAVVTASDLPWVGDKTSNLGEGQINLRYLSDKILAREKVLYHGHPVAAVAATNVHVAAEALKLIEVRYDLLPAVMDVRQAMQDGATVLLPELRTDELGHKSDKPSNVASHLQHKRGDLEQGFHDASVIVEREFFTATVHQGYVEPNNATAQFSTDGQLTVWLSTQAAFNVRDQLSELLNIPISKIRVIPMEIGGGFGGKIGVYLEPIAALLSKKSDHRPVKLTMSYADVLAATGPTSASFIRVKMGANREGRITAAQATLAYEAGAYPGSPVESGAGVIFAPYCLDNLQVDGYDVVVNKPRAAAYRAPGGANAAFASESVIDELAEKLDIDPLDFRMINAVKEGDRRADGPVYARIGYRETLEAARRHAHYSAPLGPHQGRGVASGFWFNYGGKSSASASVNADGTVGLVEGSTDIGGSRTSIAMQLAETLGISAADVRPLVADTDSVGYTEGTYGSRTTFATGLAVYELGQDLKRQMIGRAAQLWEVSPEDITFVDGVFRSKDQQLTFKELAAKLDEAGSPIMASATVQPETYGPAFATHIVDVEVDPETGKVEILRYTAVQDAGKAIHPSYVEGQMQGGVAQGVGWALNEEYVYDPAGHLLNASMLDYRMPTCLDLPMIEPVIIEVPNPAHPYGVRGVGEVSIVPPVAAIANAIHQAAGVRMNVLPMSPARVLEAMLSKDTQH